MEVLMKVTFVDGPPEAIQKLLDGGTPEEERDAMGQILTATVFGADRDDARFLIKAAHDMREGKIRALDFESPEWHELMVADARRNVARGAGTLHTREAAAILGISLRAVLRLLLRGELTPVNLHWRLPRDTRILFRERQIRRGIPVHGQDAANYIPIEAASVLAHIKRTGRPIPLPTP